nr:hypothetical protein [Mesorhizobium sp. L2C054A000]
MVVPYSKAARGIHLAYTFEYRDADQARQVPPAETPSFEAARAEAIRCVIGLLADLGDDDMTGWLVRMRDQAGNELCTIDVAEAEAARQANDNTPLWANGNCGTGEFVTAARCLFHGT